MTPLDITIPYPILTGGEVFDVTIKDSTGAVVFTSATETNTLFTVSLGAGDYEMYVTFAGATNVWCFTVFECDCPTIYSYNVTEDISSGTALYYLNITFDYRSSSPAVFGSCGFRISVVDETSGRSFAVTSFSDFTSNVGSLYTKTILIDGSAADFAIFTGGDTLCESHTASFSCIAPTFPTYYGGVQIFEVSGIWYIGLKFATLGVDCNLITINYTEISWISPGSSGIPDSGSVVIDVSTLGSLPVNYDLPINPRGGEAIYVYALSFTDCCGNTFIPAVAMSI